jgi:Putative transmembrane protein (PGPGW)
MLTYKTFRRVVIAVVGGTVLLIGLLLTVLPGPAFIVIPAGLAILGLEFAWAKRWLNKARGIIQKPKDQKVNEHVSSERFDSSIRD